MSDVQRWEQLADALAAGEGLSEDERRFVEEFRAQPVEDERAVYEELAMAGEAAPLDAGDRERAEATLAAFRQAHPPARGIGRAVGIGSAVLAVAAAVVLWRAWPAPDSVLTPHAVVSSGTLMLDEAELGPGQPVPVDRWVTAQTRTCVRAGQGTGCVSASSRMRIHQESIELSGGALTFEGTGQVTTSLGVVAAVDGAFALTLVGDTLEVEAESGTVQLRGDDGEIEALAPGQARTRGGTPTLAQRTEAELEVEAEAESIEVEPPSEPEVETTAAPNDAPSSSRRRPSNKPRAPAASASDLLGMARRQAASGDAGQALATYGALRRQHPSSPEAHAANVSIGELELRRGRAKAALRAFSRYLGGGGGALAEEAHWGKIRALHRLSRTADRDAAVEALRRSHPGSVYLARASAL